MISEGLRTATDEDIDNALVVAALPQTAATLRGLLYFLTADESLADIPIERGRGFVTFNAPYINDQAQLAVLKDRAAELLKAYRDGKAVPPDGLAVPREQLLKAIGLAVGASVPHEESEFWFEESAIDPLARRLKWPDKPGEKVSAFKVVVIGAGLSGINAAIQLKLAGFSFTVFEKNEGVGGTWHQNRYPGARVDLPSQMYSHLFAVNYPFVHTFAPQPENEAYLNWCIDNYGVRDDIRLQEEVVSLTWEELSANWIVRVRDRSGRESEHRANAVISAVGLLDRPTVPEFPGLQRFKGKVMHTAKFDQAMDLSNKRVAVIGTGASGLQMIPRLAEQAKELVVFQRSAGWILPMPGYRDPMPPQIQWLNTNFPFYRNLNRAVFTWMTGDHDLRWAFMTDPEWKEPHVLNEAGSNIRRMCLEYMGEIFSDRPDLLEKCTPDYPPMCKRFILDSGYYEALTKDGVCLITDRIARFDEEGIQTESGERVPVEVVVFATGFRARDYFWPMQIRGRQGTDLKTIWQKDGARAYWGVAIPKLPNFFSLYGPNMHNTVSGPLPAGEMQTRYALTCFKTLIENNWRSMEIRQDAFDEYNEYLDRELAHTVWMHPDQKSFYQNETGRLVTNGPWKSSELHKRWMAPERSHFDFR